MPKLTFAQRLLPLLSLLFLWPALWNGTAFFFSDSPTYIRGADAAVYLLTGHETKWSDIVKQDKAGAGEHLANAKQATASGDQELLSPAPDAAESSSYHKNILLGRSIYYGFLLYPGAFFSNFWLPIIAQALITGFVIVGASRHLVNPQHHPRRFAFFNLGMFAIGSLTSLPFFVSYLMPDLFAGLLIVGAAVVLGGWQRERTVWRIFWTALLCLSALFHSSHPLLLAALAIIMLLVAIALRCPLPKRAVGVTILAVVVGVAGEMAFASALEHVLDRSAIRPPFLSARLIADGPGEAYLRKTCPQNGFTLCNYLDRMPSHSDTLLWSKDANAGFFTSAPADVQVAIAREDKQLALEVLAHDPGWFLQTTIGNGMRQVITLGLDEFNHPSQEVAERTPQPLDSMILSSRAGRSEMPIFAYRAYVWPMIIAGLVILLYLIARPRERCWREPIALIILGVAANAFICGGLSGPYARYQERVSWIIPMAAAAFLISGAAVRGRQPSRRPSMATN